MIAFLFWLVMTPILLILVGVLGLAFLKGIWDGTKEE
jgi:hypothetical protein